MRYYLSLVGITSVFLIIFSLTEVHADLVAPFKVSIDKQTKWKGTINDNSKLNGGSVTAPFSNSWYVDAEKFNEFWSDDDLKVQALHKVGPHAGESAPNTSSLRVFIYNVIPGTTKTSKATHIRHDNHFDLLFVWYRPSKVKGVAQVEVQARHAKMIIRPVAYLQHDFELNSQGHPGFAGTGIWTYLQVDARGNYTFLVPTDEAYKSPDSPNGPAIGREDGKVFLTASANEGAVARWNTKLEGDFNLSGEVQGTGMVEILINGVPFFSEEMQDSLAEFKIS